MRKPTLDESKEKITKVYKRFDKHFLIAAGVALFVIVCIVTTSIIVGKQSNSHNSTPASSPVLTPTSSSTQKTPEKKNTNPGEEPTNPLVSKDYTFPQVNNVKTPIKVTVKDQVISTNNPGTVTVKLSEGTDLQSASDPCEVQSPTDYCLAATSDLASLQFDYFYYRDITHTRAFRESTDIRKVDIEGAQSAVFMTIPFGDADSRRVLAIASKDSSGYLIVLPESSSQSTENTLMKSISLK